MKDNKAYNKDVVDTDDAYYIFVSLSIVLFGIYFTPFLNYAIILEITVIIIHCRFVLLPVKRMTYLVTVTVRVTQSQMTISWRAEYQQ